MNEGYWTAIAALSGSAIGALASLATTWLTQNAQDRANRLAGQMSRKEHLYGEFIDNASKLFMDALSHDLEEPSKIVGLYALLCKLRLFAPFQVLSSAEEVMRRILATYATPGKDFHAIVSKATPEQYDLVRAFSQACREDLHL